VNHDADKALFEFVNAIRKPGGLGVPMLEPKVDWWAIPVFAALSVGGLLLIIFV
jgi:hypothetical protein